MYHIALQEFEPIGCHMGIVIGAELTQSTLETYDAHVHQHLFPPANPSLVREIAGDGHEKVAARCAGAAGKHAGRPRKLRRALKIPKTNGWFMLTCPRTGRVLGVEEQTEPENNHVKLNTLAKVLPLYPNCDCFIHDRNCSFEDFAREHDELKQLKVFPVDRLHATRHVPTCKNSPLTVRRLKTRVKGINTSVSEQVFSWFRGYARVLNSMGGLRHKFLVLVYCKRRNDLTAETPITPVRGGLQTRLPKSKARAYQCSPSRVVKKSVLKKPASKATLAKKPASARVA